MLAISPDPLESVGLLIEMPSYELMKNKLLKLVASFFVEYIVNPYLTTLSTL